MNQQSKDTLLKFDDIRNSILQEEEGRVINSNLIHGLNNINDFTIHTELADFISPSDKNRSIEPHEYFAFLKSKFSHTELCYLFYSLEFLLGQIQNAKKINQRKLLEIIHFNSKNILREILLNIKGINQFVEKSDLLNFVKYVKPKDSIKFIELERYHRTIPQEIVERLKVSIYLINILSFTLILQIKIMKPLRKKKLLVEIKILLYLVILKRKN